TVSQKLEAVAQGGRKTQMSQQPALRARGRRAQRLIPPGAGILALGGRAKLPAGAPLQHTARRKTTWKKTFVFFSTLKRQAFRLPGRCRMNDWPEKPYLEPKTAGQTYLEWLYNDRAKSRPKAQQAIGLEVLRQGFQAN